MADPLAALDTAGIRYSVRKGSTTFDGLAAGGELDVELDAGDVGGADRALSRVGFHHLVAPGTEPHRFYLSFERGRWLKVDAKVTGDVRRAERVTKLRRRLPASKRRRLGPVIAFLGPDGAGKGTVIEALRRSIPVATRSAYFGSGSSRSPGAPVRGRLLGRGRGQRLQGVVGPRAAAALDVAFVMVGAARAWRRLLEAYVSAWRGSIVLCDRHPIEGLAVEPRRRPVARRIERLILQRLFPTPDAVLVLDAPGDVLHARKAEHDVATLEEWRSAYRAQFGGRALFLSSTAPLDLTVAQASETVWRALASRRGWPVG